MILVRRPSPSTVDAYRAERIGIPLPCPPTAAPPPGFRSTSFSRVVGSGDEAFDRARTGLREWAAHRGGGVEVFPHDARLVVGTTVAILTRQLGLWVLAACRVDEVIDEPDEFGFVYATLPDHPVCGYESFVVRCDGDRVTFRIDAVSSPGSLLVRLGLPVTNRLQQRAATAYLEALARRVDQP